MNQNQADSGIPYRFNQTGKCSKWFTTQSPAHVLQAIRTRFSKFREFAAATARRFKCNSFLPPHASAFSLYRQLSQLPGPVQLKCALDRVRGAT
jgi:hypothetical protein